MPLSTFERFLPWMASSPASPDRPNFLQRYQPSDAPGNTSGEVINHHVVMNISQLACLVLMAVSLLFFATAVRNLLRSGEAPRPPTPASPTAPGSRSQQRSVRWWCGTTAFWRPPKTRTRPRSRPSATRGLRLGRYGGRHWAAFLVTGLGGVRNAVLPRWFARTTTVMGALALLGVCHIPPGGFVTTCSCRSGSSPQPSSSPTSRRSPPRSTRRFAPPPDPRGQIVPKVVGMTTTMFQRLAAMTALGLIACGVSACTGSSGTPRPTPPLPPRAAPPRPSRRDQPARAAARDSGRSRGAERGDGSAPRRRSRRPLQRIDHDRAGVEREGEGVPRWDQVVAHLVMDGKFDLAVVPSRAWDS